MGDLDISGVIGSETTGLSDMRAAHQAACDSQGRQRRTAKPM
jgi:hypothetical protein